MATFAVVRTGGKQYLVKPGSKLKVEKLAAEGAVDFSDVLLIAEEDGSRVEVGKPKVSTKVSGTVAKQGRAKKIRVVHYKAKVRHHKVYGHRQPFTEIKVDSIA